MADAANLSGTDPEERGEERRLRSLARTGLLDTPTEELFDRYVRVAAAVADVPISLISLVDTERQWFKAAEGLDVRETPREWAFCDHAIRDRDLMEVNDARSDDRFRANPLVTDAPHIRFYAGAPITVDGDQAIGTLCVIDHAPKILTARQRAALTDLAAILSREIETNHLAEIRADRAAAAKAAAVEIEHQMRNMFAKVGAIIDMATREGTDVQSVADTARRRVIALSQANEICLANDFAGAPMADLAAAVLRASRDPASTAVTVSGDAIAVSPAAASILAPLIDELACDARRRGALSADGPAELDWRTDDEEVVLRWTEAVPPPDRSGGAPFQSAFLNETVPTALRGRVELHGDAGQQSYVLRVPRPFVEDEG